MKASAESAAADLFADLSEPVVIPPGERRIIPTGLAAQPQEPGCALFIFARSGLGIKHGISLANGVGVVDPDYRGEILVGLMNSSGAPFTVSPGDRIAQLAALPVISAQFVRAEALSETARGSGGLGSTGIAGAETGRREDPDI